MKYVIYHKNCNDGTASALAAWMSLGSINTVYIEAAYGEPVPDLPDCQFLYILDFSYPYDVLTELHKKLNGNIQVIDHHKSAEKNLKGLSYCIFNMNKCGTVLTWEYFHPNKKLPIFFEYIQDVDLWTKKLPRTNEATAYINSYPRSISIFHDHIKEFENNFNELTNEGMAILRLHQSNIDKLCQSARPHKWNGEIDCIVVNAPTFLSSDLGSALCDKFPDAKFVCVYSDTKEGFRYYSLRSRGDFDVSVLASTYNGGGHKNAGGFLIKTPVQLFFLG